jgi:hypothetical protein
MKLYDEMYELWEGEGLYPKPPWYRRLLRWIAPRTFQ